MAAATSSQLQAHDVSKIPLAAAHPPYMQGQTESTPSSWGTRSFADTVRPTLQRQPNTPFPESMKPIKQGDFFAIDIDEGIYQQGVAELKDCLIGRIMMSQGDKPYSTLELRHKLHEAWNIKGYLELIPHARGYYTIRFSLLEDRDRIFRRRRWTLQPGAIRLLNWVQDFNPNRVCTSLAQIWVRIMDLPMEYWQPSILEAMASAFGTLIRIDDRTLHRRMGHYARILVEVDMKIDLIEKIMYKRAGVCSFANLIFERLPEFCRGCGIVGHATSNCSRSKKQETGVHTDGGRSTSRPKTHRSTSRNRRSRSRNRGNSNTQDQPIDENPPQTGDTSTQEDADDVLHADHMQNQLGNKILALPPIPTNNTFDALDTMDDEASEGPSSDDNMLNRTDAESSTQPSSNHAQSVHVSDPSKNTTALARGRGNGKQQSQLKAPGAGKVGREISITTGTPINNPMKETTSKNLLMPRRSCQSVAEEVAKQAQESFTIGAIHEQNLVAKKPWADVAEEEDAKKPPKHGSKNER
ncbi:hypothetical protein ACS0TY_013848 [Phlomoides rotata]